MPLVIRGNILQSRGRVDWLPDGNATQPSLTFATDPDTGLYRTGPNDLALTAGGVDRLRVNASGTTLTGNANITGFTTLNNDVTVVGNANITGFTTLGNDVTVTGNANITGFTTLNDDVTVVGNANISGITTLGNDVTVTGNANISGITTLNDDVTVVGNANITGFTTLNNDVTVVGNANISGTTSMTGNVTVSGNLNTSGAVTGATISGNLNASQLTSGTVPNARISGAYTGITDLTASGTVTAAAISGNLTTSHITSGTGNVDVTGNLNVSGLITGQGLAADLAISNVQITDSSWNLVDDTAVALTGGYILVNGDGFGPGTILQVGGTNATATSYVSSTQLRAQTPAKSTGTYDVVVIRGDTKTATLASCLTYSDAVTWVTTSSSLYSRQYLPWSVQLLATSDSNVTYSNVTTLPTGVTIVSGNLEGNIISSNDTVFSFDLVAEDEELQDATQTFLIDYAAFAAGSIDKTNAENGAKFGSSTAFSGNGKRFVTCAPYADYGAYADTGTAHVYRLENGSWVSEGIIPAEDSGLRNSSFLGYQCSMDYDGTRIAVNGANYDNNYSGAVYVFVRNGQSWAQEQRLTPSDPVTYSAFGVCAISGDGTRIVVGTTNINSGGGVDSGGAYVFTRSNNSTWVQEQKINPPDSEAYAYFGKSVAIDSTGTRVCIGAFFDNGTGGYNFNCGAAYVYIRSGSSWSLEQKILANIPVSNGRLGVTCSFDSTASRLCVGAPNEATSTGACYVFTRSDSTWSQEQRLTASDAATNSEFGSAIDMDDEGSRIIVGAQAHDSPYSNTGAIYVFKRNGTTWTQEFTSKQTNVSNTYFGCAVAIGGPGSHIVAGANNINSGQGRVYVYQNTYNGWKLSWP